MASVLVVVLIGMLGGCSSNRMKGERPGMVPLGPATDVTVTQSGDLICVTENGDLATRTCVPEAHEGDN